ncbi:hypothetical protein I3843_04G077200 [Carya illinoinensis]|uniref:NAC domain-containing protein n=1 Tax=Carya illinoinensis TaxID=32201 RepID=A0A922JR46_CARIL|nr:hypothetical protein I3760_04G083600 [Carya illinoinensis]KAG2711584.1 hypothetical protein I3760_04G083600 [Carya illinoinensis]KAG6717140.1 hypothetical protein I3842_04G082800 [Carya illinoinensis]KAG6717141.1 hypothetical protein I3842_04G082800 [Carya illinoinensis]KAG7982911.1 hypothetical protein I3843_04G077200 [Carya illinoinensis]
MGRKPRRQPGYHFDPTDVQLVLFYLKKKVKKKRFRPREIAEVNIYEFAPWDLQEKSISSSGDLQWYFFCPVEKKYANGARVNRSTEFGYWKSTGNCTNVFHNEVLVGSRRTMVFHRQGERTDWVMHEYSLHYENLAMEDDVQNAYVLCKIFQKKGKGPKNGARYVAPFKEEDWSDWSDVEEADCAEDVTVAGRSTTSFMLPNNTTGSAAIGTTLLIGAISESCLSETVPSQSEGIISDVPRDNVSMRADNEDENSMLAHHLAEDNTVISCGDEDLNLDEIDHEDPFWLELEDILDLDETAGPSLDGCNVQEASVRPDDRIYLKDLDSPLDG